MANYVERKNRKGETTGWQAQVRIGKVSQCKTFRHKKKAIEWADALTVELRKGGSGWQAQRKAEKMTLHDALQKYEMEETVKKRSAATEKGFIKQWLKRPLAKKVLWDISTSDIANAIKEMEKEKKGPSTIRSHLAVVSNLYNIAAPEWDMAGLLNPVKGVRKPKLPDGRDRRVREPEEIRLLEECRKTSEELEFIVIIAIETAMRQGEIMSMRWDRVDFDNHLVFLPKPNTKTEVARYVALSVRAEEVLKKQRERTTRNVAVWSYKPGGMRTAYKRAVKRAGSKNLDFHDLRHEAASRYADKGLTIHQLKAITGHKTLQMLTRYIHSDTESIVAAVRRKDDV
jgi:integrase